MDYISTFVRWSPTLYHSYGAIVASLFPSTIKPAPGAQFSNLIDTDPQYWEHDKKLRKDIKVCLMDHGNLACAMGTNFSPHAFIAVDSDVKNMDQDLINFTAWHEIAHIRFNDLFMVPAYAALASSVAAFAVPYIQSCLPSWVAPAVTVLPYFVGSVVHARRSLSNEKRADAWACQWARDQEVVAMQRTTHAQISINQQLQPQYPHLFYKNGDLNPFRFPIAHIPLAQRYWTLDKEVKRRGVAALPNEEELKKKDNAIIPFIRRYKETWKLNVDSVKNATQLSQKGQEGS